MKRIFVIVFLFLGSWGFPQGKFYKEYSTLYQNQTQIAFFARAHGDWLTLIQLAKQAHKQKQKTVWENGLIEWAKEIILYSRPISGAWHLAGYYKLIGDKNKEYYWKSVGDFWKQKR